MNKTKKEQDCWHGIVMNVIMTAICLLSIFGAIGVGLFIKDILIIEDTPRKVEIKSYESYLLKEGE